MRHGRRRLVAVDGDAHQLRAGAGERRDLPRRRLDVRRVGVGHRLHDDRRAAADHDAADIDARQSAAGEGCGGERLGQAWSSSGSRVQPAEQVAKRRGKSTRYGFRSRKPADCMTRCEVAHGCARLGLLQSLGLRRYNLSRDEDHDMLAINIPPDDRGAAHGARGEGLAKLEERCRSGGAPHLP